ncbi:MAG TPA: UrcA family protein [Croceibacterium sp.]|nr:UrcA family protein [Croceibacterium sp.]
MKIQSLALALAAAAIAVPAAAADTKQTRVEVSYTDLDLSTEAGRKELDNRFDKAAREMCGVSETGAGSRYARDCYKRTSQQMDVRVAAILRQQGEAAGG